MYPASSARQRHSNSCLLVRADELDRTMGWTDPFSGFVHLRKAETEREQAVLLAHCPGTREAKALAQSQFNTARLIDARFGAAAPRT